MSRISHANSIDRQISELNISTSPNNSAGKPSSLAARRKGSPLRINTTTPVLSSHRRTNDGNAKRIAVAAVTPLKKAAANKALTDARTGKPFSVKNLDTGETIDIAEIDRLISQDSLTTFSSPYAKDGPKGNASSPLVGHL